MKMKRPEPSKPIDSTVMRRLDALERLINDEYGGRPKVFEDKTGVKMAQVAQVAQWFTGYRALRDKALRRLEETTGKPEGPLAMRGCVDCRDFHLVAKLLSLLLALCFRVCYSNSIAQTNRSEAWEHERIWKTR